MLFIELVCDWVLASELILFTFTFDRTVVTVTRCPGETHTAL